MRRWSRRWLTVLAGVAVAAAIPASVTAQDAPIAHNVGESITPAFEGWYRNADGTFSLSFGYMNRNYAQEIDIPVGPGNRIEPGHQFEWYSLVMTAPSVFGDGPLAEALPRAYTLARRHGVADGTHFVHKLRFVL